MPDEPHGWHSHGRRCQQRVQLRPILARPHVTHSEPACPLFFLIRNCIAHSSSVVSTVSLLISGPSRNRPVILTGFCRVTLFFLLRAGIARSSSALSAVCPFSLLGQIGITHSSSSVSTLQLRCLVNDSVQFTS
jgi:hypothetical protein